MRHATRSALLALAALVTLSGCGIEPSEVVEVGRPATGVKRPGRPATEARLYFAYPGGLFGVVRPAGGEISAEEAVPLLLQGPNEAERMRGLYSDLPKIAAGKVQVTTATGQVAIRLPVDPTRLPSVGRTQLVCTAAHNAVPGDLPPDEVKVQLSGAGRTLSDQTCDNRQIFVPPGSSSPTR
ncbi:hypothetical protein AB0K09_17275 [Streptomyces sp. NPDC049577]|uniref:hypothetical protein n=1 Tax=Streptomyces sp. NPDC049577 TaxID=3155153 RepID=UPI003432161C